MFTPPPAATLHTPLARAVPTHVPQAPKPRLPPPYPLPKSIANFKPTPREVLSGIAPHLFDDCSGLRGRRRSRSGSRSQGSRSRSRPSHPPGVCVDKPSHASSPLRVSAVLTAWDENGNCVEQEMQVQSVTCTVRNDGQPRVEAESGRDSKARRRKLRLADKSRWRTLNLGTQLKTIIIKLKPASISKSEH